jgi:hypothetical protein
VIALEDRLDHGDGDTVFEDEELQRLLSDQRRAGAQGRAERREPGEGGLPVKRPALVGRGIVRLTERESADWPGGTAGLPLGETPPGK